MNIEKFAELKNIIGCYLHQDYMYDKFDYAIYDVIIDWQGTGLNLVIDQINHLIEEVKTEENLKKILIDNFELDIFPNDPDIKTYTKLLERIRDVMIKYLAEGANNTKYFFDKVKFNYLEKIYMSYFSKDSEVNIKNIDLIIDEITKKFTIYELESIIEEVNFLVKITITDENLEDFLKTEINFKIIPQEWGDFNSKRELLEYMADKIYNYKFNFNMSKKMK
ncbi:contact-dependent growth inhibition system immunity protein [Pigmentibacter sp. JX0631]|uniref:contact-dependent growth inhibition system immunity protein n=1 Tax=Pigmentibacter sp. JX0631 TaxID=2976982 RepID=UPI0024682850|nr:contact-dependent growth inhibition system immunity protein [Pigmentibacter sp. JX0631]WGL61027.1 contact-dependent growth inhibition system immunity protein [Pigmentibacter sp. JX0631]